MRIWDRSTEVTGGLLRHGSADGPGEMGRLEEEADVRTRRRGRRRGFVYEGSGAASGEREGHESVCGGVDTSIPKKCVYGHVSILESMTKDTRGQDVRGPEPISLVDVAW